MGLPDTTSRTVYKIREAEAPILSATITVMKKISFRSILLRPSYCARPIWSPDFKPLCYRWNRPIFWATLTMETKRKPSRILIRKFGESHQKPCSGSRLAARAPLIRKRCVSRNLSSSSKSRAAWRCGTRCCWPMSAITKPSSRRAADASSPLRPGESHCRCANSEFNRQRRKLPLFLDFWTRRLFPSYTSTRIRMTLVVLCNQHTLAASSEKTLSQGLGLGSLDRMAL
jgi:hypothetical protein